MTILGNFSDDAFEEYQRLISEEQEINFSEDNLYDFTRCVRPNGSAYGTGGKCRQGSESAKEPKPSGKTRPKAAIEADMRKLTSSGAMQQRGLAGVKARAEHASLKAELNKSAQTKEEASKRSQVDLVTPQKQGQADVDRMKKYLKDESDKLKNLNDAQKQNPSRSNDPDVVSRKKVLERNIAAVGKQLKDLERSKDTTNNPDRQAAIARISKEKGISAEKAGVEVDKIRMNELNEGVKKYQSMADKAREDGFASRAVSYGKQASELIRERADLQAKAKKSEEAPKTSQVSSKTPYRVSQEDVDRTKKIIDGEKQNLQNLNDSVKKNPELGKDPEVQKQRKALEATVKSYYEALVYIMDRQAAENK